MSNEQMEFADFFEANWEPCLRAVVTVVGSPQLAEDQVAEAFARAFASWRKVGRHPAPRAWVVRTALNTGASWWRRRSREVPLTGHDVTAPGYHGDGVSAGLQSTLRADGVPASVTFLSQPNPACSPLGFGPGLLGKILPGRTSGVVHHLSQDVALGTGGKVGRDMVIDPSAIPSGAGLQLAFSRMDGPAPGRFNFLGHMALVHASRQCTGS